MLGEWLAIFCPIVGVRLVLRCKGKSFWNFTKQHLRDPYLRTKNPYTNFSAMPLVVPTTLEKRGKGVLLTQSAAESDAMRVSRSSRPQ
jgi:hypothetical protein